MEYPKFQVAVIGLARRGTRITVANVVARLDVDPDEAERHIAKMVRDRRLELEDEDDGASVYRVPGLSKDDEDDDGGIDALKDAAKGAIVAARAGAALRGREDGPLPIEKRRKLPLAVALGAVLPGIGLVYAAPWKVALAGVVSGAIALKILAWLPFFIGAPIFLVLAIASGVLGGLYAWQYNQKGKRSPLGEEGRAVRRLASRLKG